jgi:beta-N-acetylhexosaminidase
MRSGRRKRTGGVAAVTLIAAVGLLSGACSSGGSKPAANGSATTTTTTPPTTTSTPTTPSPTTSPTTTTPAPSTTTKPPTTPPPATSTAPATPGNLTLQQLAGQRVIYSYQGLTPPQHLLDQIRAGDVGGVIFFGGNISSESQITGVITELRQAQAASPVHLPLLLMTDQEGGIVKRLPGPPFTSAKQVGESANPVAAATTQGRTWRGSA